MIPSTLQRIIEHFGLTVADFGFRPGETPSEADLRRAMRHSDEYHLFMVVDATIRSIESLPGAPSFGEAKTHAALNRINRKDLGLCNLSELTDEHVALAALAITGRVTRDHISALCWSPA